MANKQGRFQTPRSPDPPRRTGNPRRKSPLFIILVAGFCIALIAVSAILIHMGKARSDFRKLSQMVQENATAVPAETTPPETQSTQPAEETTAPTEPEPTTEPTTAPTEPPREDTLFYALVYGVDGRRSAAGLPALTLDDTLCSEAAMAIQHYLSTGASPVGCTVVALDPALTDGEMEDLFLTLCGDETILSEAYARYGVALTSDSGVYYAAGFFA